MTSISKLIVGGFKSIRERTEIPIAPLTFLFGPNSAGKSAVLGAVNALLERIEEGPVKRKGFTYMDKPPPAIERGSAYLGKERKSYADDDNDDLLLESYPNVTLGVQIEDFSAINTDPIDGIDVARDTAGEPKWSARSLYWAMDGTSVQVEISEYYVEDSWRFSSSQISIDQIDFIGFVSIANFTLVGIPPDSALKRWTANPEINFGSHLGMLSINIEHPILNLPSITDGAANFHSRIDREMAIEFDFYRINLKKQLKKIKEALQEDEETFLHHMMVVDRDRLYFRAATGFLSVDSWMPEKFYKATYPSFRDMWSKSGLTLEQEELNLSLIQDVNTFFDMLHHLGLLILGSTANCLRMTSVEGDRQVLKPDDVTVQFPDFYINHLRNNKYWARVLGRGLLSHSVLKIDGNNPYLSMYAFWLGHKNIDKSAEGLPAVSMHTEMREDFVNYVLNMGVLGPRRYEVKPEVWSITTKQLAFRDPLDAENEDNFENVDLKVQLYLEDQNGRRLDFHEVGSGISYVMPILASLHSAKTSWIAQPELHLHPAAQCEMGDVFLRAFNRGHFSVVETHSEHLLLRVLKRIRQTTRGLEIDDDLKCAPEAVSVLYFDPQEDGSTQIRQMRVSRLGDFKDRWPNGFFEERGRELFDE